MNWWKIASSDDEELRKTRTWGDTGDYKERPEDARRREQREQAQLPKEIRQAYKIIQPYMQGLGLSSLSEITADQAKQIRRESFKYHTDRLREQYAGRPDEKAQIEAGNKKFNDLKSVAKFMLDQMGPDGQLKPDSLVRRFDPSAPDQFRSAPSSARPSPGPSPRPSPSSSASWTPPATDTKVVEPTWIKTMAELKTWGEQMKRAVDQNWSNADWESTNGKNRSPEVAQQISQHYQGMRRKINDIYIRLGKEIDRQSAGRWTPPATDTKVTLPAMQTKAQLGMWFEQMKQKINSDFQQADRNDRTNSSSQIAAHYSKLIQQVKKTYAFEFQRLDQAEREETSPSYQTAPKTQESYRMIRCPHCGNFTMGGQAVCQNCGKPVEKPKAPTGNPYDWYKSAAQSLQSEFRAKFQSAPPAQHEALKAEYQRRKTQIDQQYQSMKGR